MMGLEINKRVFVIFLSAILLYDCIFVNLRYSAEIRYLYFIFPPRFYQTVLSKKIGPKNPCALVGSCTAMKDNLSLPPCYCDSECGEYGDCCFDVTSNGDSGQQNLQHDYKQFLACETEVFSDKFYGILVVSDCPAKYNFSEISEKCRLPKNVYPVSADDGTTFRNVYCAYCHNVSQYNAWRFEYQIGGRCPASKLLHHTLPKKTRIVIENNCVYKFIPPSNARFRGCLKQAIGDTKGDSLCSRFQSPVLIDDHLYRNVFCYNVSLSYQTKICVHSTNSISGDEKGYGNLLLTGIFNIRPVFEILGRKKCEKNYNFDMAKDACVPYGCREGEEDSCGVEIFRNHHFSKLLEYVTDNIIDNDFVLRLASFFYLSLPTKGFEINVLSASGRHKCGINKDDAIKSCCRGFLAINFLIGIEMSSGEIMRFISNVNNMKWGYTEIKNQTVVSALDVLDNANLTEICDTTGVLRYKIQKYLKTTLLSTTSRFVRSKPGTIPSMKIPKHAEGVMIVFNENSPKPQLSLENWKLQFEAKTESKYPNLNSSVEAAELSNDWSVFTILTYVTMGTSCCFLLLTLIVYSCFGLFRSTSGVTSKYMMMSMLAAQFLFITGVGATGVTAVCTAVGIISHYLWLCSFNWISLVLYSILKMIYMLYNYPGALQGEQKTSKWVYIFGFLMPFVIVLPCAFLDLFSEVDIGYSDGDICFPTGSVANLLSFTIPVVISLCFNIVSLVVASVSLSRYNNTVLLLQSVRQARSNIPIYWRLCILCACPWILGIIAIILPFDVLRYTYILLAGSHGTFVGFSFLLSKSVRSRINCARQKNSTNELQLSPM